MSLRVSCRTQCSRLLWLQCSSHSLTSSSSENIVCAVIFVVIRSISIRDPGGCDWADVLAPLRAISSWYEPLFLFYIFLMCFGVLNVVVGAFVATTQQIAANDPDAAAKYAVWQMESFVHRIRRFFKQADVDRTGASGAPRHVAEVSGSADSPAFLASVGRGWAIMHSASPSA